MAEDLAHGRVPANMLPDEQVVYDFTTELHRQRGVNDALYKRAVDTFGEQGVADFIAVNGYSAPRWRVKQTRRMRRQGGRRTSLILNT